MAGGPTVSKRPTDASGAPESAWGITAYRTRRAVYRCLRRRRIRLPWRQAMPFWPLLPQLRSAPAALAPSPGSARRPLAASTAARRAARRAHEGPAAKIAARPTVSWRPTDASSARAPESAWGITAYRTRWAGYRCLRRRRISLPRRQAMRLWWPLLTHRPSAHPSLTPLAPGLGPVHRPLLPPSGSWWRGLDCSVRRGGAWARRRAVHSVAGMGELPASSRSTTGAGASATASNRGA
jgi:hypothetical protein